MSVEAHIQQLEQRHQVLESQLSDLIGAPSASDNELLFLKRKKLKLKDEISRLKSSS